MGQAQQVELIVTNAEPVRCKVGSELAMGLALTLQDDNGQKLYVTATDPEVAAALLEDWTLFCAGKRASLRYVFELSEALGYHS